MLHEALAFFLLRSQRHPTVPSRTLNCSSVCRRGGQNLVKKSAPNKEADSVSYILVPLARVARDCRSAAVPRVSDGNRKVPVGLRGCRCALPISLRRKAANCANEYLQCTFTSATPVLQYVVQNDMPLVQDL